MKQSTISKLKLLKATLLTLFMMLAITTIPLTVQADDNGTKIDTDKEVIVPGVGDIHGWSYPGPAKTGWLLYLYDAGAESEFDRVVSKVVYVACEDTPGATYASFLTPRLGSEDISEFKTGAEWGTPFDGDENSRQPQIRDYMEQKVDREGFTLNQSAWVVADYLGESA